MRKRTTLTLIFSLVTTVGFSQNDTGTSKISSEVFDRIAKTVKDFQLDTSSAPNDKTTRKIKELRSLRGGFNINEAIGFKMEEDRQKKEISEAELNKLSDFFSSGDGRKWLDNAMIWIYRQHFTYRELKQLVKFYKTAAGRKMATDFPLIVMQSLRAAEMIRDLYAQQQKK